MCLQLDVYGIYQDGEGTRIIDSMDVAFLATVGAFRSFGIGGPRLQSPSAIF
jgi:hypothetical protein